jgi:hypothetical protein
MPLKLLAHDYLRVPRLEVRLVLNSHMCIFAKPLEIFADSWLRINEDGGMNLSKYAPQPSVTGKRYRVYMYDSF